MSLEHACVCVYQSSYTLATVTVSVIVFKIDSLGICVVTVLTVSRSFDVVNYHADTMS